jgi:predicted heme/steroid binding protein/uncharacterized membrane protein
VNKEELYTYNGKDGKTACISYRGKIYDVSESKAWKDGMHMGRHQAGNDLTEYLPQAPHGEEVFARVEQVGVLGGRKTSFDRKESLRTLYRKFHPHPISIHFPIGLLTFGALMQLLFLVAKNSSFAYASFYAILCGTISVFPAVVSGILSWWINYGMIFTRIFKNKLIGSLCVLCMGTLAVTMKFFILPDIFLRSEFLSYLYNGLLFMNVPVIFFVAYNGGKITWPS